MYVIPPPNHSAVLLHGRDGSVQTFSSLEHALRALGYAWISRNVGAHFRVSLPAHPRGAWDGQWVSNELSYDYILRDADGDELTAGDFTALVTRRRQAYRRYATWNGEGAVPGTRKYRGGGRRHSRRVRTSQEKRLALVFVEEGEVPPRGARNRSNIPDSRGDIALSRQPDRNWKKYRHHQWKERP